MSRGHRGELCRKQSLYFPDGVVEELEAEARRVDRSLSWVVQRCVRTSLASVQAMDPQASEAAE